MIWNLMGSIGDKVLKIVDKDETHRLKLEVQRQLIEIKSGDIVECGDGTNVISITAWRQDTMTYERWNQLVPASSPKVVSIQTLSGRSSHMAGLPGMVAAQVSKLCGSSSYLISIASAPSSARALVSATTMAIASPT